jgi:hypothetical protein
MSAAGLFKKKIYIYLTVFYEKFFAATPGKERKKRHEIC